MSSKASIRVGRILIGGQWRDIEDVEALVREALAARAARQPRLALPVATGPLTPVGSARKALGIVKANAAEERAGRKGRA